MIDVSEIFLVDCKSLLANKTAKNCYYNKTPAVIISQILFFKMFKFNFLYVITYIANQILVLFLQQKKGCININLN